VGDLSRGRFAATTSNQADRARVAGSRAQDLEPKLSRLSVELAPDVARITGVSVKRSGQRVEPSLYGTPLPSIRRVPDRGQRARLRDVEHTDQVEGGGASASVRVPALIKGSEPAAPQPLRRNDRSGAAKSAPLRPLPAADTSLTTQQTLGVVVGGLGVIGVGLGTYFGIRAISKNSDAEDQCPNAGLCNNERGLTLTDQAKKNASASNVAFAVGGVLVATGAVLYLTGGRGSSERVSLVPLLGPAPPPPAFRGGSEMRAADFPSISWSSYCRAWGSVPAKPSPASKTASSTPTRRLRSTPSSAKTTARW